MSVTKKLVLTLRRWRGRYRRLKRLIYMSPAEARFVELMGGKVWRSKRIFNRTTKFPLTIVITRGKLLKAQKFRREKRYGKYFVDFANDLDRIIEIDGSQYHMDVVADLDRDIYIKKLCWERDGTIARILRIPAFRMDLDPQRVQDTVLDFVD